MSVAVGCGAQVPGEQLIRTPGLSPPLMPQQCGLGVMLKGTDGRYTLCNSAAGALLGRSPAAISGQTDRDVFPPDALESLRRSDEAIRQGAAATQTEIELSNGGPSGRWLLLKFPVLGASGQLQSIGTVMLEVARQERVNEMRQALLELEQNNRELRESLVELDRLASTDKLTGAWNRRRLEEAVANEMDRLKRYDHPLSILLIDVDFFKRANDRYGHAAGDSLLAELTGRIRAVLRATDSLTRWGGEEFIALCPNTPLSTAGVLAQRLRQEVERTPFALVGGVTVSIGVAECMPGETWEAWFHRADAALYRAKAGGRNQVQQAPESPQRDGAGEKVSADFLRLIWKPAYACGHDILDNEHQALFRDANELLSASLSKRPAEEIAVIVDKLVEDVERHFRDEEAVLGTIGYPGTARHAAIHRGLLQRAGVLIERMHRGKSDVGEIFQFLANDVIAKHMLDVDRDYFPYLGNKQTAVGG